MAHISSIAYQPQGMNYQDQEHAGDYIRVPFANARLVAGHGIEGDQKAGHHPERQINLVSQDWLDAQAPKGYRTRPGQFGEQMIITGIAVEQLSPGTRLQLGAEAVVEVAKARTGCPRLESAQGKPIAGLGPLGVMVRVITDGAVSLGDTVAVLE